MKYSHTALLVEEVFEKIQEFNYKRYTKEFDNKSLNALNVHSRWQKHKVNQILEKFDFLMIGEV
jgi:hypothetical protein